MGAKHRDLETVPGFLRWSAQREEAGFLGSSPPWSSGRWIWGQSGLGDESRLILAEPRDFSMVPVIPTYILSSSPMLLGKGSPWRATAKQEGPLASCSSSEPRPKSPFQCYVGAPGALRTGSSACSCLRSS